MEGPQKQSVCFLEAYNLHYFSKRKTSSNQAAYTDLTEVVQEEQGSH